MPYFIWEMGKKDKDREAASRHEQMSVKKETQSSYSSLKKKKSRHRKQQNNLTK